MNDNGLVYDAGLVVDFGFRTVDPVSTPTSYYLVSQKSTHPLNAGLPILQDIYGGGTLTRFSTAWSRVAPSHDFCSSTLVKIGVPPVYILPA